MKVSSNTVLITGASSGIGRAMAAALYRQSLCSSHAPPFVDR